MRKLFVLVASVALLSAGCGGGSKTPTAPSSSQGASASASPVTGSGTINGTLKTGSAVASGMTVGVVNTSLSTRSDSSGRFTLASVPAGNVSLRISGNGADATVAVGTLQASQTMQVTVNVSGSSASVEDDENENEPEAEVKGPIQTISSPNFTVGGRTVRTTSSTIFKNGSATVGFSALKQNMVVEVKGTLDGSTLNATVVEIENENEAPNPGPGNPGAEAEVKGAISGLTGTASNFTFKIGSDTIKGNSSTTFDSSRNSGPGKPTITFADLKNGLTVEVKGTRDGTTVTASRIKVENEADDDDEDENENEDNEVELKGTLGTITAIGAGCSAGTIRSTVAGTTFTTSASTRFETACSSLTAGMRVEVEGTRQSNGQVLASKVKRD